MPHMGSLAPYVTSPFPQLRAANGRAFGFGFCNRVVLTVTGRGQAHLGGAALQPFLPQDAVTCNSIRLFRHDAQAIIASENPTTTTSVRLENKVFEVEMQVQKDDVDQYGVVNNAIYVSYIHHARDVLLEYLGIGVEYWVATGNAMALSELNLKYFAPLKYILIGFTGDRFVIRVWPEKIKGVRMVIRHLIEKLPDKKLVLDAGATIVFLNKDYRPTRVFPEVAAKAWEMFSCREG